MTVEDKRNAIERYCDKKQFCAYGERIQCPLYKFTGGCYGETVPDETIDKYFGILVKEGILDESGNLIVDLKTGKTIKSTEPIDAKEDLVNHPSHYTNGGMECIDEMILIFGIEATMHFCLLNAWKYRRRALDKNGQQDMDKSHWYINKYKELKVKYDEQRNVRLKSI